MFVANRRARSGRSVMLAVTALSLLAAGCGGDDDDSEPAVVETTSAATPTGDSTTTAPDAADTGGSTGETTTTAAAEFVSIDGVPGVSDDEIRFALLGTATASNPTGSCYLECFTDGVEAAFAYQNSIGGVFGRQLVLADPINDELGRGQELALQIISDDDTFGVFATPLIPAPYAEFAREGVPTYAYLTAPDESVHETLFGSPAPTCVECVRQDQAFIAQAVGASRVAALGYAVDSSATCAAGVEGSFDAYGDAVGGAEVVYTNAGLAFGLPDGLAPEVSAMIDAEVDLVFTCMDANGVKSVGEEMRRQGLDAVLVQNSSYDAEFFAANADAYEGAVVQTSVLPTWAGEGNAERALFEEWIAETGGNAEPEITAHAWVVARLAIEGIQAAGAPFDRQSVLDATNAIEDFTAGGFTSPWDPGRQRLVTPDNVATVGTLPYCRITMLVINGVPEPLAPSTAEEPFVCWDSQGVAEYTDPVPTAFE